MYVCFFREGADEGIARASSAHSLQLGPNRSAWSSPASPLASPFGGGGLGAPLSAFAKGIQQTLAPANLAKGEWDVGVFFFMYANSF